MSIIIDPSKLINIDIYYIENRKNHGHSVFSFINSKHDLEEKIADGYVLESEASSETSQDKIIKIIKTSWKLMTWKDQNMAFSRSIRHRQKQDGTSASEIDLITFRDHKLKACLKKWNLKDEEGNNLEVTEGLIDNLHPLVAQELLAAFDQAVGMEDK